MSGIEALQAVAASMYLLTMAVVGCRLLFLAHRSRALPELLLGVSLILGGVIGALLEAGGLAAIRDHSAQMVGRLLLAGKLFGVAGLLFTGLFTWRVFRPGERWAGLVVAALVACSLTALCGFAWHGTFSTAEIPSLWFGVEFVGRLGAPCWMALEAIRYYGLMRRRLRLGLADPVVTNRFLLWALAAGFSIVLLLTSAPPVFLDPIRQEALLISDLLIFSVCGVASSICYWLAFFPPAAYRHRLHRHAEARG
jgi:hypothetical protein